MARSMKLALAPLIAVCALLALTALPAAATSPASPSSMVTVQLLCVGDCSGLPAVPLRPDGSAFDFGLGWRAVADGADLTIQTEGSVFVYGPVLASESISMTGADLTFLDSRLEAPQIILNTLDGSGKILDLGDVRIDPGRVTLESIDHLICACVSVFDPVALSAPLSSTVKLGSSRAGSQHVAAGGAIAITSGSVPALSGFWITAQAITGQDPEAPQLPGLVISPEGDVYLDVSRVTLGRFEVMAAGSIVVAGASSMPVPEPGTALLLGLGLVGLAFRRRSGETGQREGA